MARKEAADKSKFPHRRLRLSPETTTLQGINLTKYCKFLEVSDDVHQQSVDLLLTRIEALIRHSAQHAELFSKLVMVMEAPADQNKTSDTEN